VRIISLSLSRVCLEGHFCPQKHPSKRDFSPFLALKQALLKDFFWSDPKVIFSFFFDIFKKVGEIYDGACDKAIKEKVFLC
jgi:hypothetical protein